MVVTNSLNFKTSNIARFSVLNRTRFYLFHFFVALKSNFAAKRFLRLILRTLSSKCTSKSKIFHVVYRCHITLNLHIFVGVTRKSFSLSTRVKQTLFTINFIRQIFWPLAQVVKMKIHMHIIHIK